MAKGWGLLKLGFSQKSDHFFAPTPKAFGAKDVQTSKGRQLEVNGNKGQTKRD